MSKDAAPGVRFETRPASESYAYLADKAVGEPPAYSWLDVYGEEHVRNFVVAKMMQADLLADTRDLLLQAHEAGWSNERTEKSLTELLQTRGWWGKQRMTDPLTGASELVQLGSPRRVATIVRVNMAQANMTGRWERLSQSAATRNLVYHHTPQPNPRLDHESWDGITLPFEHPFWRTHMPKNGWNCKCTVSSVRKQASEVTSEERLTEVGAYKTREWRNKRTGEVRYIPEGVDPGFDYNPGIARAEMLAELVDERTKRLTDAGLQEGADLMTGLASWVRGGRAGVADHVASTAFGRFVSSWAEKGKAMVSGGFSKLARAEASPAEPWHAAAVAGDTVGRLLDAPADAALTLSPRTIVHGSAVDMSAADWRLVQRLIDDGEIYMQPGARTLVVIGRDPAGRGLELVVHKGEDGLLWIGTFYRWTIKPDKLARKRRRYPAVRVARGSMRFEG